MVTREQARQKALACVNEMIKKEGGNAISVSMPRKGKCSWTWNEYKQAIVDDCDLKDGDKFVEGTNPIDTLYRYMVYREERNLPND